jgi:uncharacterized protein YjiS (DUF1127 family)
MCEAAKGSRTIRRDAGRLESVALNGGGVALKHRKGAAGEPSRRRPGRDRITRRIRRLIWTIHFALDVRRERLALSRMDDRALKDIGLNRNDIYAETSRPFWDIPRDRLLW